MTDRKTTTETDAGLLKLDDERAVMDVLARSVLGPWNVVNDLTRVREAGSRRSARRGSQAPASVAGVG